MHSLGLNKISFVMEYVKEKCSVSIQMFRLKEIIVYFCPALLHCYFIHGLVWFATMILLLLFHINKNNNVLNVHIACCVAFL